MTIKKELVGLNTYLYTFGLSERGKYNQYKARLECTGTITEVFIDNKLAFWHRISRIIGG